MLASMSILEFLPDNPACICGASLSGFKRYAPDTSIPPVMSQRLPVMLGHSPNITGSISGRWGCLIDGSPTASGALITQNKASGMIESSGQTRMNFSFDASLSSALYGASRTVQTDSMFAVPCIKT